MNKSYALISCCLLFFSAATAQSDSVERIAAANGYPTAVADPGQDDNISATDSNRITVRSYFHLLGSNFGQIARKPFHLEKKDWIHMGEFAAVATVLSLADEPIQYQASRWRNESQALREISGTVTKTGAQYEWYILGGLGAYSFAFKNEKLKTSVLLATQAYITGAVVTTVLKRVTGRQRPYIRDLRENEPEPIFHGLLGQRKVAPELKSNNSFPSGHTTVAFAVATVFALQYHENPCIVVGSYALAALTGVSRITENQHWATDVLAGAAVGILTGRLAVHTYHAMMNKAHVSKNTMHFNLQYANRQLVPGVVYSFN